jgi:lysophospholipase L1-like esterase
MFVRLSVGGAEVETKRFRFLHSMAVWPGTVQAAPDHLVFIPNTPAGAGEPERVIMLVPKESEAEYRKFRPLKALAREEIGKEALFLGDPLVEGIAPKAGEPLGVGKSLAALLPGVTWQSVYTPGPHRYLPIFRVLADLDAHSKAQPGALPPLAIVCLGGGDVIRQTPLHTFERAVDALLNRLRLGGAKRIVVVGVLPEPGRERQCEPYQERVQELLRQHHVDCVDVLNAWVREGNWASHYALEGMDSAPVFGPVPNAAAREQIAKMIRAMF